MSIAAFLVGGAVCLVIALLLVALIVKPSGGPHKILRNWKISVRSQIVIC